MLLLERSTARAAAPVEKSTPGVLFAMCLALVLVVASVSAVNLALPELAVSMGASNTSLTWIADAYTVALAAFVLPLGALGDAIGRRRVLLVGTALFAVASVAAGLSDSTTALIAWRAVMGLAAAMIMPGTLSTITAVFPPSEREKGVAVWSGFAGAGAIGGLLAAGALLDHWSWRSIFYVTAAAAVVAGLAAIKFAPETKDENPHRFDIAGTISTVTGVGALVFAIIEGSERGWTEPVVVISFVTSALAFIAYYAFSMKNPEPMLDPRLFRRRGFLMGSITVTVQFMAFLGFFFVALQYLLLILDYSPLKSAVALIPVAAVILPVSTMTPRVLKWVRVNVATSVGLLFLTAGMLWIATLDSHSGYLPFLAGLIVAGAGIGVTSSTGTSLIVTALPTRQQGVASAMNDTTREVGSAVGIALMGAVFTTSYADHLPSLASLPATAATAVQDSAAAGLAVAEKMGNLQLAEGVKDAFMSGLTDSLVAISAFLVVAAIANLWGPKKLPESPDA
ncbi:MAG: MFS transporter [Nocardiaceae bacterium]|nr:MFS transporter [Nocardiaceae bacterium]